MQGAVVAVLQVLQLVAGRVRPKDAGTGQHTHMDGDIRHRGEIAGEGFRHQLRRVGGVEGTPLFQGVDTLLADMPGRLKVRLAHAQGNGVLHLADNIKKLADPGRRYLYDLI